MDHRFRDGILIAGLAALPLPLLGQARDSLPPGVTSAMVAAGKKIFGGAGLCLACHGPDAKGGIGPNLTDTVWIHHDGSYDALVKQIVAGIDEKESKSGQIMPPRGGSGISDADVKAVAAYVWTLSRSH